MQTESRIWSDSGVEPAAGDEVYAGQERPIAEYDNWAMWAVTKDIDEIATVLGDLDLVESVTKVTFDTEANRPADSQDGHVYFEVDTGDIYGYSGGSWTRFEALGPNSVGTDELDLSIAPTWTGNHRFDGGVTLAETRSVTYPDDAGAQTLADVPVSSSPAAGTEESISVAIDGTDTFKIYAEADGAGGIQNQRVEVPVGDFRLPNGSAIEDGTGNDRLILGSATTTLRSEAGGNPSIVLERGTPRSQINVKGNHTLRDQDGNFDAITYTASSSSPGTFELTNADLDTRDNKIHSSGSDRGVIVGNVQFFSDREIEVVNRSFDSQPSEARIPVNPGGTETFDIEFRIAFAGNYSGRQNEQNRLILQIQFVYGNDDTDYNVSYDVLNATNITVAGVDYDAGDVVVKYDGGVEQAQAVSARAIQDSFWT